MREKDTRTSQEISGKETVHAVKLDFLVQAKLSISPHSSE